MPSLSVVAVLKPRAWMAVIGRVKERRITTTDVSTGGAGLGSIVAGWTGGKLRKSNKGSTK